MVVALLWKSSLRISAFLCVSAVKLEQNRITAESQRYAEVRRVEIRALRFDAGNGLVRGLS
jgi:hypothetical protein